MRTAGLLFLLLPPVFYTNSLRWPPPEKVSSVFELAWKNQEYTHFKEAAARSTAQTDYRSAAEYYGQGAEAALRRGDRSSAARFFVNRASNLMAEGRYRDTLTTYQQARHYATEAQDSQTSQTVYFGLANLYMAFGDRTAAALAARQGLQAVQYTDQPSLRMSLYLILGRLEIREQRLDSALPYFFEAIATGQTLDAQRPASKQSHEAEAWDNLGFEMMQFGRLDTAEEAFCRAWRLRQLRADPRLPQSYALLSSVFYAKRDLPRAKFWNERAARQGAAPRLRKPWMLEHRRGQIAELEGDAQGALQAYQRALVEARRWRSGLIPSDHFWTHGEVEVSDLFDDLLRVSAALPQTAALRETTFQVLQESHAWSMQAQLEASANVSSRLPAGYQEELTRVRQLEARLLGTENAAARAEADQRRVRLLEMEAAAGMPVQMSGKPVMRRDPLEEQEAVLTFHTSEPASQLWLLTRQGLQMTHLPGRKQLAAAARAFHQSVYANAPDLREQGAQLLNLLLGSLREPALAATHWRIVLDNGLFDIPFSHCIAGAYSWRFGNRQALAWVLAGRCGSNLQPCRCPLSQTIARVLAPLAVCVRWHSGLGAPPSAGLPAGGATGVDDLGRGPYPERSGGLRDGPDAGAADRTAGGSASGHPRHSPGRGGRPGDDRFGAQPGRGRTDTIPRPAGHRHALLGPGAGGDERLPFRPGRTAPRGGGGQFNPFLADGRQRERHGHLLARQG